MTQMYSSIVANIKIPRQSPQSPDGSHISPSVEFLTKLSIEYVTMANKEAPLHLVHLTRGLVGTLKTAFNKLTEDDMDLQYCAGCTEDKTLNYNDRLQLMSLMQFLIHGLEPVEQGKMKPRDVFEKFFTANKPAIESRVKGY